MKTTENKEHFKLDYKGFQITNTWNSDGYVVMTEDPKYFLTKVEHTVGYRHCGNHLTLETAKETIDRVIMNERHKKTVAVVIPRDLTKHLKVEFTCGKWYIVHKMNGALLESFKTEEDANRHLNLHKAAPLLLEALTDLYNWSCKVNAGDDGDQAQQLTRAALNLVYSKPLTHIVWNAGEGIYEIDKFDENISWHNDKDVSKCYSQEEALKLAKELNNQH